MFKSKKKLDTVNTSIINTIIGNNSKIEGVLYASDLAMEILVAGTVYGNLTAEQRIELTETGCVLGDLITKTLVIDEGASFKGNCMMEVMEDRKAPENFSADFHGKASPGQEKVKKEAKGKEGPKEVNEVEKI